MKILFLTDNFPPEVNAPATRTYEHCKEWVKQGEEVTVITCTPNFPQGKVYTGYRNRLYQKEIMDGIRVIQGMELHHGKRRFSETDTRLYQFLRYFFLCRVISTG